MLTAQGRYCAIRDHFINIILRNQNRVEEADPIPDHTPVFDVTAVAAVAAEFVVVVVGIPSPYCSQEHNQ